MISPIDQNIAPSVQELIPSDVLDEVRFSIGSISGIIEVATGCNLACDYCFAHRPDMPVMPVAMVERIIRQLLELNGRDRTTKFIWHGGEPLLAGIGFFEQVVAIQQNMARDGYTSANALQTNATLLDDNWIDFFREHAFGVGSSLDGLPQLHDAKRRAKNGNATYQTVVERLHRAKERGLTPGVSCMITAESMPHIEEIYANLKMLDLPFTMSPITPTGNAPLAGLLTPEQYSAALIRLFDCWFDDPQPTIQVNPPHSVLTGIIYGGLPLYCSADDSCLTKFISFLPDGTVYPCNRFAGHNDFLLGNIMEAKLADVMNSATRSQLLMRTRENIADCAGCDNSSMCRGGCAYHAYSFHGDVMASDHYCTSFFTAFNYYKKRLDAALHAASEHSAKEEYSNGNGAE